MVSPKPIVRRLGLLARRPAPGRAAPRLVPALGESLALELHRAMLSDTLDLARAARIDERFLYWDDTLEPADPPFDVRGFQERIQSGATIGARLSAVLGELLQDPSHRAVLLVADVPARGPAVIDAAFDALARSHLVLAPSHEGGLLMLGLTAPRPALFTGLDGSGGELYARTIERARSERLSFESLEPMSAVETPADVAELVRQLMARPEGPPRRTRDVLRSAGLLPPAAR